MKSALPALALLCAAAMAQQPPQPYDTAPKPVVAYRPCQPEDQAYFVRRQFRGSAVLLYRVTALGRTDGLVVAASSGESRLDAGAIECAREWRYSPATKDGAPVDAMWSAGIAFNYDWSDDRAPDPQALLRESTNLDSCVLSPRPDPVSLEGKPATSVVRYRTKAGAVTDARLKTSSGVRELDARALACVKGWTFADKLSDGKPADGEWTAVIDWREGVPLEESSAEVMAALPCDFADRNGCRAAPPAVPRGGEQEQCAGFVEDKRLRTMAHAFAVEAKAIAAERGITLDWNETSVPRLEEALEVLRQEGDQTYDYAKLFGSYLAHLGKRGVWGYVTIDGHRVPTVQTWRGCVRYWPWAKVLNRLQHGNSGDVAAYYQALQAAMKSDSLSNP